MAGSTNAFNASTRSGSFFRHGVGIKFFAAAADRIGVEAGDLSEPRIAAVADLLGLQGSEPAALLFVEAAENEVRVAVEQAFGMIVIRDAGGTLAFVNGGCGHCGPSVVKAIKCGSVY